MFLNYKKNNNLESEIFTGLVGFGIVIMGIYSVLDFVFNADIRFKVLDLFLFALFSITYYVTKSLNYYNKIVFPFSLFMLFPLVMYFFIQGGFKGTALYYFILISFTYSILISDKRRTFLLLVNCMIILSLLYVQFYYPEVIDSVYRGNLQVNSMLSFVLAASFIVFGAISVRKHYDSANTLNLKQNFQLTLKNIEIKRKNKELKKKASEIEEINQRLNELVKERTEKIKLQNSQLIDYAFFNSHKVRGPLARVMGLVDLLKNSSSEVEKELYLQKLDESAKELDGVVCEINKILVEP